MHGLLYDSWNNVSAVPRNLCQPRVAKNKPPTSVTAAHTWPSRNRQLIFFNKSHCVSCRAANFKCMRIIIITTIIVIGKLNYRYSSCGNPPHLEMAAMDSLLTHIILYVCPNSQESFSVLPFCNFFLSINVSEHNVIFGDEANEK